jgi:hypothetical protein
LAVLAFLKKIKGELGITAMHCKVGQAGKTYTLLESREAYRGEFGRENEALTVKKHNPVPEIG